MFFQPQLDENRHIELKNKEKFPKLSFRKAIIFKIKLENKSINISDNSNWRANDWDLELEYHH